MSRVTNRKIGRSFLPLAEPASKSQEPVMTAAQQVALVTGASSGIGKATAIALATAGFQVIGTGRNTARSTAPAGVTYLDLDVTNDESVATVVKQVIDQFGHIDVLVNNAGVGATGAAEEFSIARRKTSS